MRLVRLMALSVLAAAAVPPAAAQIPRNSGTRVQPNLPRLMVSNPYVFQSSDSATSVAIGSALRERMERVAGGTYNVLTREQMNTALREYEYPQDAILLPLVQRTFAVAVSARVLLGSTLARNEAGRITVTARLAGLNDDAGTVVSLAQEPGQSVSAFGSALGDLFQPAIRASKDAKACVDTRGTDAERAAREARNAIRQFPRSGLAWFCLAQIAADRGASPDSLITLLRQAAQADPQSLPALTLLAQQFQAKNDTANVVQTYQQMIVAAPTNEPLRKAAFDYFLAVGRIDAARKAVEEAIELDEFNPELYDLLSNVCIFENNYRCAVDALEQSYAIDSTKADSTFYMKIVTVAALPADNPDTTRLIKWAELGVRRNPGNSTLISSLLGGYALIGSVDSMISVAYRLLELDTTSVAPALLVANELAKQGRIKEALPLLDVVARRGTPQDKENAAILLVNGALPLLQEPQDLDGAADLSRRAVAMSDSTGRAWVNANYVLGLAAALSVLKLDPETERTRSCDLAHREEALVDEASLALNRGRSVKPEVVDRYIPYLESMKARTASMIRAYCR